MEFAASAAERQQFAPIIEWMEKPLVLVESRSAPLAPFHPTLSVPGRAALRVITKTVSPQ
jgi:hypothetical protein